MIQQETTGAQQSAAPFRRTRATNERDGLCTKQRLGCLCLASQRPIGAFVGQYYPTNLARACAMGPVGGQASEQVGQVGPIYKSDRLVEQSVYRLSWFGCILCAEKLEISLCVCASYAASSLLLLASERRRAIACTQAAQSNQIESSALLASSWIVRL